MRNSFTVFGIVLVIVFNAGPDIAQQQAGSEKEDRPAVTFEMLRNIVLDIHKRAKEARERGNELTELDAVRALEAEYADKGPAAHKAVATALLTLNPVVGNYREALRYADIVQSEDYSRQEASGDQLRGYKPMAALDALSRAADSAQVVMINEAHHVPQHRAFTIDLLKALKRKGFSHFATETLYEADTRLNERGYPTSETGFYTSEPVYGDLARTALKLGYRVVAYEPKVESADQRERDQARNLVERILKDDPKAKFLVHAGYSHIDESGMKTGAITMAQRFKEMTGIDPFTIDQTEMTERSARRYERPLYRYAVTHGLARRPTVFKNAQGSLWSLDKATRDVTLFHPRSHYIDGRPTWLRLNGSREPYRLPKNICGDNERCLARARFASESEDAIPIDQLEIPAKRQKNVLLLPAGEFMIEVEDPEGNSIKSYRIRTRKPYGKK